jgi:tetratricopeptide (TPR) repeat protein
MKKSIKYLMENFETKTLWHLIIIILLLLIVYFKVVNFEFINTDEKTIIVENYNIISDFKNIDIAFESNAFLIKNGQPFYRPIQTISFMLDASVSGKNPWMYHLSSLFIHIATCIALYFFLKFLNIRNLISFLFVLLFSVHPLFIPNVAWLPARGDLLIGLFGILLFMTFGKYFQTGNLIYFIMHFLLFLLIIFTKETALLFPILLLFYYFFILRVSSKEVNNKSGGKILFCIISWVLIFLLYFFARNNAINNHVSDDIFGFIPFIKNISEMISIFGKFFIPINISTMPVYDIVSFIIGIIFFLLIAFIIIRYIFLMNVSISTNEESKDKKKQFVLMGLIWFLLFTIPPMFFRHKLADVFYVYKEHRSYLPMVGIIIIIAYYLNDLLIKNKSKYIISILTIILFTFAVTAYMYCDDYKDCFTFYTAAINSNPQNAEAYANRGIEYSSLGDYQSALIDLNKSIEIREHALTYYNRGYVKVIIQDYSSAEMDFTKAVSLDPKLINAYIWRANVRMKKNDYDGALEDLNSAEKIDPNYAFIFQLKGNALLFTKNYKDAIQYFSKAISFNHANAEAYNNRGFAKLNLNDFTGAIEDCNKALQINPNYPEAYLYTGEAYREQNNPDEAIKYFNFVIDHSSNFAPAYYQRGITKQIENDIKGACEDWNEALRLGYNPAKDMLDKFCK